LSTYFDTVCERLVSSGTMAPRTLEDYRSKSRLWIVPALGAHRLDRLLPEHLDSAYSDMYAQGLSSSTVLKVHRILSRALTVAVRRELSSRPRGTAGTGLVGSSHLLSAYDRAKPSACAGHTSIWTPASSAPGSRCNAVAGGTDARTRTHAVRHGIACRASRAAAPIAIFRRARRIVVFANIGVHGRSVIRKRVSVMLGIARRDRAAVSSSGHAKARQS
jgi:hypothetical protein